MIRLCIACGRPLKTTPKSARSNEQNRYYWGVVVPLLAEHCGYSRDEIHDALKYKFLRTAAEGPLIRVRGTSELDTAEFSRFIDDVRMWAESELFCRIPAPNEIDLTDEPI